MSKKGKIFVTKNGPYRVIGRLPLKQKAYRDDGHGGTIGWTPAQDLTPKTDTYVLCRCGRSQSKPFCDGSHQTPHFDGTPTASTQPYLDQVDEVTPGDGIELLGVSKYCAVARFCHPGGGTWSLTEQSQDPVCKNLALKQAQACPSGRLVMRDTTTGKLLEPDLPQEIVAAEDQPAQKIGPLQVTGGVEIEDDVSGQTYAPRNRVTLCRCGRSTNKPFCNGSHMRPV